MTHALDGDPAASLAGDRFLEWKTVKSMTGFSRTTAWRRQKAGDFPTPRQISPGRVGWLESEVNAWQASRAPRAESDLPAFRPLRDQKPLRSPPPSRPVPPHALAKPTTSPPKLTKGRGRRRAFDQAQGAFDF